MLDHRGRLLADIDPHELWRDVGPCLACPGGELHAVLRDGVAVRLGRTVRTLRRLEGALGGPADGRDQRPPVPVGQHSWRFLTACPPQATTWTVLLGRGASFLTVPVGQGMVYCYCYADITTDGTAGGPDDDPVRRLRERFAGFAAPVPQLLEQLDDPAQVHIAPIEQVAEERWGQGAVVLVGDAAHGMSPNMTQGACLAFEDAWCRPPACATPRRAPTRWPASSPGEGLAEAGSAPRPTAATGPATSRRHCGTSPCGSSGGGSSEATTARCWSPSRSANDRRRTEPGPRRRPLSVGPSATQRGPIPWY